MHPCRAEARRPVAARNLGLAPRHGPGSRKQGCRAPLGLEHDRPSCPAGGREPGRHSPAVGSPARPFSRGRLERVLRRGEFAVTAELTRRIRPILRTSTHRAKIFDGWVDGINAVDASGANCHMSSVGICALLTGWVMRRSCRSPAATRTASPSRATFSVQRRWASQHLVSDRRRRSGRRPAGRKARLRPRFLVAARDRAHMRDQGASFGTQADDPTAALPRCGGQSLRAALRFRPVHLGKKDRSRCTVRADAVLFRRSMFRTFMDRRAGPRASREDLSSRRRWAAGFREDGEMDPLQSSGDSHPDAVIKRLEGAADQKKEGKQLCIDIINEVKEIPGVAGMHVMAYRQEEYVAEIVDDVWCAEGPEALEARSRPTMQWSPNVSARSSTTTSPRRRPIWCAPRIEPHAAARQGRSMVV